eukprot:scaffold240981_cov17-Tisochrysis_lutea.AAC.2
MELEMEVDEDEGKTFILLHTGLLRKMKAYFDCHFCPPLRLLLWTPPSFGLLCGNVPILVASALTSVTLLCILGWLFGREMQGAEGRPLMEGLKTGAGL